MGWLIYAIVEVALLLFGVIALATSHMVIGVILLVLFAIGLLPFGGDDVLEAIFDGLGSIGS